MEARQQDQEDTAGRSACLFFTLFGLHIWRSATVFILITTPFNKISPLPLDQEVEIRGEVSNTPCGHSMTAGA